MNAALFVFMYAWICLAALAGVAAMIAVAVECVRRRDRTVKVDLPRLSPADQVEMRKHTAWVSRLRDAGDFH